MMTKRVPIDTYCEKKIPTLQKAYDGLIDYVDISSVDNTEKKIISYQTIEATDAPSRAKQVLKQGDVLVSTVRPNLNAVAVVEEETENLMVGSTGYCVLRCKNNMDVRYLFNFCQSQYFIDDMSSQATGASYPAVSNGIVRNALIPCYPIEEQREIAEKLDTVSKLLVLRKQQLSKLDELVKSRFIEMFGDPIRNTMNWPICELSECIEFLTSGSRGWAQYFTDEGEYFITIKNVKNCRITLDDVQHIIPPNNAEAKRTKVKEGDLLISITADLGRTGVVTKEIAEHGGYINQHLTCIRLDQKTARPLYVAYYMESEAGKCQFQSKNQSAVKAGLNFNAINSLRFMLPPIELQDSFIEFIEQTDKSKFEIQQSLEKLETLKKALMQKYFG